MRQYLKFHSRALVNVFSPNERYFLSSFVFVLDEVVGIEVSERGAWNLIGMCGERKLGSGNRNRRSRRSLLNNAIK